MDGEGRIVLVETKTVDNGTVVSGPSSLPRYQLGNHLGTSVLELDGTVGIIRYEEYHPYGSTAWWAGDSATLAKEFTLPPPPPVTTSPEWAPQRRTGN